MSAIDRLKRQQTKMLAAIVRRVRSARRLHRHVPHEDQFIASAALTIIKQRRKRK